MTSVVAADPVSVPGPGAAQFGRFFVGAPLSIAFLNENALGHGSYLPRFARELARRPELGVVPRVLDVLPLPADLQRRADFSVRGLRKLGLDFQASRWRSVTSARARALLDDLRRRERVDAVVVNTQSVALDLADLAAELPLVVCLDATFDQLARSPWFAPNRAAAWLQPLTLAGLRAREARVLRSAAHCLVWSAPVRDSLVTHYGLPADRIETLPPSLDLEAFRYREASAGNGGDGVPAGDSPPRLLFVGGDFVRKGGPALLEAYRSRLRKRCELRIVTQGDVPEEPGVSVHRQVTAGSEAWLQLWQSAEVFVFPSRLETFGIVLLEALAFGVPVVSSRAGAAADILGDGRHGVLLGDTSPEAIAHGVEQVLADPAAARIRAQAGRERVERDFSLSVNAARLAERLSVLLRGRGWR